MCVVFVCVQTMVWLPVLGIFNMHTDADACINTRGLNKHCKRVCTQRWLWVKKKTLPQWGLKPTSVLCLAFGPDTFPGDISNPQWINSSLTCKLHPRVTNSCAQLLLPIQYITGYDQSAIMLEVESITPYGNFSLLSWPHTPTQTHKSNQPMPIRE